MKIGTTSKLCSICYNQFEKGDIIRQTPCKHLFHTECIKPWFKNSQQCPNCRFEIQEHFNKIENQEQLKSQEKQKQAQNEQQLYQQQLQISQEQNQQNTNLSQSLEDQQKQLQNQQPQIENISQNVNQNILQQ
ncbi:hypothetical protein PPERSA_12529 [Pseudocohnilembus persalinus]|uniref:RING-type domain-containing protein n=1 Tax=Pseudocohnilembus persalinus TaxID=266149 RepID=A0A0V0QB83_PSEPJ|nr:hypothetical protein PPERSA_12529 [Pseudocohnilembus persalinus]|eukprot:KRW99425.1 hypothetical protein PPERSA_12529 [Pseudocohnilembus persalinus]